MTTYHTPAIIYLSIPHRHTLPMQKVTLCTRIFIRAHANHGIVDIQVLKHAACIVLCPVRMRHVGVCGSVGVEMYEEGNEVVAHDGGYCAVVASSCVNDQ